MMPSRTCFVAGGTIDTTSTRMARLAYCRSEARARVWRPWPENSCRGCRSAEVVAAITRHGEATAYRGDKVALVGGSVLLTPKTAEMMLAQLVIRIRRVSNTLLHNASLPEGSQGTGPLRTACLRCAVGARIQGICSDHATAITRPLRSCGLRLGLATRKKTGRKRKTCGISIFVFRDD